MKSEQGGGGRALGQRDLTEADRGQLGWVGMWGRMCRVGTAALNISERSS